MTTLNTAEAPARSGVWTKAWTALRYLDETLHHDPAEVQRQRIEALEARLKALEATALPDGAAPAHSTQARFR
jgi:hypothetical protein